jgi:hypothetical protein
VRARREYKRTLTFETPEDAARYMGVPMEDVCVINDPRWEAEGPQPDEARLILAWTTPTDVVIALRGDGCGIE